MEKEHPEGKVAETETGIRAVCRTWWKKFQDISASRHAPVAVFVWSFFNPLLIPFPAESLLAPLVLANKKRAVYLTALASIASALGAGAGYFLSLFLYDALVQPFIGAGIAEGLAAFSGSLSALALFGIVFIAALTLIPDPPFIAAAGLLHINFPLFLTAFFLGRTLRFVLVIGAVMLFGREAWLWFEKGERKLETVFALLLALLAIIALFIFLY